MYYFYCQYVDLTRVGMVVPEELRAHEVEMNMTPYRSDEPMIVGSFKYFEGRNCTGEKYRSHV